MTNNLVVMSKKLSKEERVCSNLFFGVCIEGELLKELILKVMNQKKITGELIMG